MSRYDDWMETLGPSVVYRFYADDDQLLYVGCTNSTTRRFAEHFPPRQSTPRGWQAEVSRIETVQYPDRRSAEEEEARAIFTEGPLFNGPGGISGSLRRLFGDARPSSPLPRIRERIARRLGEDPGVWAHRRRREAVRIPFAGLATEIRAQTGLYCTGWWLTAWARESGEDPWTAAVDLQWSLPAWTSAPSNPWAYEDERWRLP